MIGRRAGLARGAGAVIVLALLGNGLAAAAGPEPDETAVLAPGAVVAARVAISPVIVRLEAVRRVGRGKASLELRATVVNLGDLRLSEVVVSLVATPGTLTLRPGESRTLRQLAPGDATVSTWAVCTTVAGAYSLVAIATLGGISTESRPLLLTLDAAARC